MSGKEVFGIKTQIDDDSAAAYVMKDVEEDLTEIPGIGPAAISKLEGVGITTGFSLYGT